MDASRRLMLVASGFLGCSSLVSMIGERPGAAIVLALLAVAAGWCGWKHGPEPDGGDNYERARRENPRY